MAQQPQQPSPQIPSSYFLEIIGEKDCFLHDLQRQLRQASEIIESLQAQLQAAQAEVKALKEPTKDEPEVLP